MYIKHLSLVVNSRKMLPKVALVVKNWPANAGAVRDFRFCPRVRKIP